MFCSFFKLITIHDYHLKIQKFTSEIEIKPTPNKKLYSSFIFHFFLNFHATLLNILIFQLFNRNNVWAPTSEQSFPSRRVELLPWFYLLLFLLPLSHLTIVTFLTLSPIFSRLRWLSLSSFLPSQSDLPLDRAVKLL